MKALVAFAQIPRSTYYDIVKKLNRPDPDTDLKAEIQSIYNEHEGRYGYRRIRDELANRGRRVNHKKVQRIMKTLRLKCVVRMKKYKSYKWTVAKIAPNILDRNFTAVAPNEKWVTDISEFGEKLYLSPVLDLFNGEIITYTIGSSTNVFTCLRNVGESIREVTRGTPITDAFRSRLALSNEAIPSRTCIKRHCAKYVT